MEHTEREQQVPQPSNEAKSSWRDGALGHQLVDLLEQSTEIPERE